MLTITIVRLISSSYCDRVTDRQTNILLSSYPLLAQFRSQGINAVLLPHSSGLKLWINRANDVWVRLPAESIHQIIVNNLLVLLQTKLIFKMRSLYIMHLWSWHKGDTQTDSIGTVISACAYFSMYTMFNCNISYEAWPDWSAQICYINPQIYHLWRLMQSPSLISSRIN